MKSVRTVFAAVLGCLAIAAPAVASLGGPLTVEVLGWDPATQRLYAQQVGHDQSTERDCAFYFDLRSKDPARAHVVRGSESMPAVTDTVGWSTRRAAWQRLRHRLRPLVRADEGRESFIRGARVVRDSTVQFGTWSGPVRQFVIDVSVLQEGQGAPIRVTAYLDPAVRVLRRYQIPGGSGTLVVLARLGDPNEGGYESQGCVLIGVPDCGPQWLDSFRGVLPWR
jgi:hypothetical protein